MELKIKREISSAGSEHLPYKQGVTGSNPVLPTTKSLTNSKAFLFMHYVYILYSLKIDKFYVGESADIETRLLQHNSGFFKGSYTSRSNDWEPS